ncbi:ergothioneine biosynthesis protein EgtB [bacterium]|nr:ergothioneine biosynthesis protein EgtB [bacterium]
MLSRDQLIRRYQEVRRQTETLCAPLTLEEHVIQGMEDASPPAWNLAHVTWFFEAFVLGDFVKDYTPYHPKYAFLFNSYYVQAGPRHRRDHRGMVGRPTVEEIVRFRGEIDNRIAELIHDVDDSLYPTVHNLITLGLNHEQQHQELMLTDVKYNLYLNPLLPAYREDLKQLTKYESRQEIDWVEFDGGLVEIGYNGAEFSYDNELPRHRVILNPFKLRNTLVTVGEYLDFIEDGGYQDAKWWLSDGFATCDHEGWEAPLYWMREGGGWKIFTLSGPRELNPDEPVTHISHYEADAFATWSGKRLPTEFEWEHASQRGSMKDGNFVENNSLHPAPAAPGDGLRQMFGDVWEWTASAYLPYPGFKPADGAIGEYNGKFMSNQMVLRGGSCATPRNHIRTSYRNFFHADKRWQFNGIRLADDAP